MKWSIRRKLTAWYVGTVTVLLAFFIGADVIGLRRNLLQRTDMAESVALQAWEQALWEHSLIAVFAIAVVSVVGYGFIRRAFRPVREIVRTTRGITAEDLSRRVDAHGDMDEIGDLAKTINEMISRLEQSFHRLKRFTGDAAHELKTPLTVLQGELEIALRKERPAGEYREILQRLGGDVGRLMDIVENLLLLTRIEEGALNHHNPTTPLHETVLAVYEQFERSARDKGVTLSVDRIDEVLVPGDPALIGRLLGNILSNAVKFTPAGGRVALEVLRGQEQITVTVSDTGIGIPEEDQTLVFERFYRVDPSRSKRTGGSGLGLAIVREIADAMGLTISLKSKPGTGTMVTVVFPSSENA